MQDPTPHYLTEADERDRLATVRTLIRRALDLQGGSAGTQFTDVMEMKQYLQEGKADMDHVEKASLRQDIDQMTRIGDHTLARAKGLVRLLDTPYFARIDFSENGTEALAPLYIGLQSFRDEANDVHLIYDWRAPISGMFYDFELGPAFFDAPAGRVSGEITRKRQYRVREGELDFMLESSISILDDVLQEELGRGADDRMRNIVATIQRDQNTIIRNERTHTLVIQGAAGSGKTSIALHRIAFLLYKFKDSIASDDILIISPSQVFANYISQVLPELGETMVRETTMETLASHLLRHAVKFETFAEQVARLLEGEDLAFVSRIRFKADPDLIERLHAYANHLHSTNIQAESIESTDYFVPDARVKAFFQQCGRMPYDEQIRFVTETVVNWIKLQYNVAVTGAERTRVRMQIRRMVKTTNLKALYKGFYTWLEVPAMFKAAKGGKLEYADVFPLIYLTFLIEGMPRQDAIKHLVIDEMQDYTPVQYRVVSELFRCSKTVLGDQHQAVSPFSSSSSESIQRILPNAECMVLNKSYRSTLQITEFAQRIIRNPDLDPVERHGESPRCIACADTDAEHIELRRRILVFHESDHHSLGIVCKTQPQADAVFAAVRDTLPDHIHLLNAASTDFTAGVVITTAHLAKGLEFDTVIVPQCTADNYRTRLDRHMLYVACTRAMHQLTLTHAAPLTPFLTTQVG